MHKRHNADDYADKPTPGRPSILSNKHLRTSVEENPQIINARDSSLRGHLKTNWNLRREFDFLCIPKRDTLKNTNYLATSMDARCGVMVRMLVFLNQLQRLSKFGPHYVPYIFCFVSHLLL